MAPRRERGFTLLELIVAAGILALIAVFAWRGLDALIREREAIASSQAAIDVVQRAFARIERDALLANDAELDDNGTLRLVAGRSSVDGTPAATVEYRLVGGALQRSIPDAGAQAVLGDVASLSIEAWLPKPGGGGWVRSKPAASEAPLQKPATSAGLPAATNATNATNARPLPLATGPTGQPVNQAAAPSPSPSAAPAPLVAAATGIRLSFERTGGARIVRAFMVGGA